MKLNGVLLALPKKKKDRCIKVLATGGKMIGVGAIALSLGIGAYSTGSTILLLCIGLLIPLNWWILILDDEAVRQPRQIRS